MGGFFFPTQEDYDSYEGFDYSDPLGINKLKKPEEETPNFLGSLMNWANKYEYEGTHDIDPITGEVSKKSLPGILGGVVGDLFSIPKRGVDYVASKASGLEETKPAEEILTNTLFPKYDSAPISNNFLKPFIESVPGGALVTAHDNLSKLKKSDFKPISDAAEVGENALRGGTRAAGSLLLDPTLWTGLNAPGALGSVIGGYFGVEGLSGAGEKLGESYSKAFDQGKPTESIEPFIESLILGGLGAKGIEHSGKTLPEVKLGDYSTRSNLNFESSPAPREIPNFVSAMADGKAPSSEAPSFITDLLEPDSLIKRRDELKDLGVLVNPTGRVPRTESLFHGTGYEWATKDYSIPQSTHFDLSYSELLKIMDDIHAGKYAVGDILPDGHILKAINSDGSVNTQAQMGTFSKPEVREFNPFSSRKASSSNLHGGPFYFTDAMSVAEGSYAAAGEGQGPNPEIITADVTTNKTWNLDAPVPRDIRVKGLTLLNKLVQNAENPQQASYYRKAYDRLKQARIGRDVESIMADVIDRSSGGEPIFDRSDNSGLHYEYPKLGLIPKESKSGIPLRQRDIFTSWLSPKDKFLRVLESDLGYDSVKHGSKLTGGEVTIPFSRTQIKTKDAQKVAPLSERSIDGLVAEYKSLDPSREDTRPLREALLDTIQRRVTEQGFSDSGVFTREEATRFGDDTYRQNYIKELEQKLKDNTTWERTSGAKFRELISKPINSRTPEEIAWIKEQDAILNKLGNPITQENLLRKLQVYDPDKIISPEAMEIARGTDRYERVEPELTPEDEALIKTPLYESLKSPSLKVSESKTPETTDIKDWIDESPKDIPVGEWVDKAARALGYQDVPNLSRIQGEGDSKTTYPNSSWIRGNYIADTTGEWREDSAYPGEGYTLERVKMTNRKTGQVHYILLDTELIAHERGEQGIPHRPPNKPIEPLPYSVQDRIEGIRRKDDIQPLEPVVEDKSYARPNILSPYEPVDPAIGASISNFDPTEFRAPRKPSDYTTPKIRGESLSESAKFIQSQKRKYGKEWETKQTQSEGDYLRRLLSKELAGEKVEETPPTVIQNRESQYEEVDPEIEALRDSISEKSPYEMVGRTPPEKSSLDKSIERVISKRPPKTPVPKEVDLEGASTKKTSFQVSLSNGEVYTVKANDEIGAREQVQDLIDKHGSKFQVTDVKPKYSKLESDLITSANPTEERVATKAGKEVSKEEVGSQKWEESQRQKAQLQELRDQLKVERQKAQAGDKEAKLREKAIEQELRDKLKVEQQFRNAEAKRKQKEFQAKIDTKEPSGLTQFLGSVKALASSGDLGHIARQGKQGTLYLLTHKPSEVGTAFKRMAKQAFSEKEFTSFHEKLAQDPKLLRMSKDFRLDMPGLPGHLGEEAFHGGEAIESAPVIGAYVKASDRAYTSYMNSIRYSLVKDGISRLEKSGFTMDKNPEKYRELARGINIITQRGDISGKAAQLFNTASNVFWAPRAKYSRIQQIGELVKPGESGRLARQGLAHTMAFNALLFGLLKAKYGDDVKFNTDPTNTDFLKIRIKNTTVDPWFGLGAIIRSANQGISGEKTSGSTGKTVPVSASDAVGNFLTNSLAPGITMLYELASGKSTLGFEKSRLESLLGVAPLAMRDIKDITEEHGLDGLLLDILSYEGEQVNTFNPQKAKKEQERLKKERGLKPSKPKSSGTGTVNYKELYNF